MPAFVHAAQRNMRSLTPSTKKLIGTIVILLWVPVYALLAMRVGISVLTGANPFVELIYYAIAGTAWIIPIGLMLPWMSREPRP
ncbi:MAG: DUF2842 domain-containing protein [Nitrosotalea sp.]